MRKINEAVGQEAVADSDDDRIKTQAPLFVTLDHPNFYFIEENRQMQQKILFSHTPKCAGAASQDGIISAFGQDSIFLDYDDNPANPLSGHCIDPVGSARNARTHCAASALPTGTSTQRSTVQSDPMLVG
ncbi:hypothetical protein OKC48_17095 [Methylorubrum extorquens]|uniref:hypothetical protein n=1 Tax=Methylorubrum extorquens TaxID=408 RepID=UPI002237C714|nr:hypothetical protein [Methylorubrum extorquens]UYW24985.1 hypothetical protein OKC48_17095 [Methylorubrum extorquens]